MSLPQYEGIRGTLESVRRKQRPPLPSTFDTIGLTDEMRLYVGQPFIRMHCGFIVCITPQMLELITQEAKCYFMYGTFYAAPKLFKQLYTFHV